MNRIIKTKIICTIGPATESVSAIRKLYKAGMSMARINCSHGDHPQYRRFIRNLRTVSKDIAIMLDTQGPEIRTGMVDENTVLKDNSTFKLTTRKIKGNQNEVSVTYHGLVQDAKKGDRILLDSGFIELKVLSKTKTDIICKVINGGPLGNQKGVNHPGCLARIPAFTKKDKEDLGFGMTHNIDYVAASFVRTAQDIRNIRAFLKTRRPHTHILAKIENSVAVENIDSIIKEADGIMVARGDLGVELPQEQVPLIQKMIIRKCNLAGKPVVTATQMLETMVTNPRPTRAEASDVANAILDGTDAIMLSEETAVGRFYEKAVDTMARIARNTEPSVNCHRGIDTKSDDDAIADAVHDITRTLNADKIVVATCSGHSARMVSKNRPKADIIAVTPNEHVVRRMRLYWGIIPLLLRDGKIDSTRDLIYYSIHTGTRQGLLKRSDKVVVTAAHPFNIKGKTNLIELHSVKEILDRGPRKSR
ncbi:pyruvate kinase [Candidatus Woesearchaeota archaeon]|nr:pyruvate kinase [Candidatus Woesearchaeota archaeon]